MSVRYTLQARPAAVATLPPRRGPQSVRFSMARSVRSSTAIDTGEARRASAAQALPVRFRRHG